MPMTASRPMRIFAAWRTDYSYWRRLTSVAKMAIDDAMYTRLMTIPPSKTTAGMPRSRPLSALLGPLDATVAVGRRRIPDVPLIPVMSGSFCRS